MPSRIRRDCPAKVNLFLEILGKRPDGYHELVTVMVPIDLCDTLEVVPARRFELRVEGARLAGTNTVEKAYRAVARRKPIPGVRVRLVKRIPAGSGLGGGSSDAAAMIEALNELFDLEIDRCEVGAEVGSDVNFFFLRCPGLSMGRGERITALPFRRPLEFALLFPPFANPTRDVYSRLKIPLMSERKSVTNFLNSYSGDPMGRLEQALFNRLETPALKLHPYLRTWMSLLGPGARMTGSGSAVYRLNPDRSERSRSASRGGVCVRSL